ncbi:hypothetical protein [Fervidibacillus albus]|uniref:Uncharacterized protein n=1 Tax=Fervidibacillus albus TaxID=2980026 RepID=A0A9E8RU18_9BACI|nr:hypothetical protein [Fervidibacillus albus]WAA08715.1 hypothetical protein OE104_08690 [Fervidibacillus albus]
MEKMIFNVFSNPNLMYDEIEKKSMDSPKKEKFVKKGEKMTIFLSRKRTLYKECISEEKNDTIRAAEMGDLSCMKSY